MIIHALKLSPALRGVGYEPEATSGLVFADPMPPKAHFGLRCKDDFTIIKIKVYLTRQLLFMISVVWINFG
jgi:hypothetical protein